MEKSKIKSILPKPSPGYIGESPKRKLQSISTQGKQKQKKLVPDIHPDDIPEDKKQSGHRPVTLCTFCRQHKIKCNASDNYPSPCQRCDRMGLKCEIDPQFRPKKGSQIQSLKSDVDELKSKIELLTKNESLLTQALTQHNLNFQQQIQNIPRQASVLSSANNTPATRSPLHNYEPSPASFNDAATPLTLGVQQHQTLSQQILGANSDNSPSLEEFPTLSEFQLGNVTLTLKKAEELHHSFMIKNLPYMPILSSRSAGELYHRSQLLFWTVMVTAALSEPEPTLYMSLASLIKQLAIETCWIKTPRSTHVIQALIILSIWPLPNEKVLDDCSYRFIGLAKNLSLQLGLHRGGEFIKEFSRTQVHLGPDSDKWRTRSWLAVFFCEQFWSSVLGLPPSINTTDYLLENARIDQSLPKNFRSLISLSIFQCKLINVMGISVTRPDGLLEPSNRAASLNILDRELDRLRFKLKIEDGLPIEVYFLYVKLMICCFAFLPGTPIEDQVKYVSSAYLASTRVVTIVSQMLKTSLLIELPIYIRQGITYSAMMLFKLHLSKYLLDKFVDSSRQSIVTVHRLLRNTLSSWKDLQNDISRNAKALENLNIVLYTYPDIFVNEMDQDGDGGDGSIISRMRSHLTASLFYDLIWCVHEGRRRTLLDKETGVVAVPEDKNSKNPIPLPFYNQISRDDFNTITTTTPNGTTVTTLVPTDQAMTQARSNAGVNKPLEINGIPISMLDATGSVNDPIIDVQDQITVKSEYIVPQTPAVAATPQMSETPIVSQLLPSQGVPLQPMFSDNLSSAPYNMFPTPAMQLPLQLQTPYPAGAIGNGDVINQIDTFFQQQSTGWLNNNNYQDDDFLGWFDASEK